MNTSILPLQPLSVYDADMKNDQPMAQTAMQAAQQGARIFSGSPCGTVADHRGEDDRTMRYSSNGSCVECNKLRALARQRKISALLKLNSPA